MSPQYAFVTLVSSDSYLPGALALAGALKDVHQPLPPDQQVVYETVCMVTPETVDVSTTKILRKAFDVVIGVEVLDQPDRQGLALLGRLDLDTVLTKLHVLRLTQYSKVIFLDADVLPVRPLSNLFNLDHEFAAVPDVGWPDIFNSGMMVLSPGEGKFNEIFELLKTRGSWDGGDQGILNEWRGDNWHRLSFTYNTTPTAIYTYAPAYERFGSQISAIHFIGPDKPWHSIPYRAPGSSTQVPRTMSEQSSNPADRAPLHERAYNYSSLVDRWYDVYDRHYRSQSVVPSTSFKVPEYTSMWNEHSQSDATEEGQATLILSLEDLRRAALEGMGSLNVSSVNQPGGEGEYRTMPLEGRFDLIRPLTRTERKRQEQASLKLSLPPPPEAEPVEVQADLSESAEPSTPVVPMTPPLQPESSVRWTTLPTPGPDELPAAPHTRLVSLPPTPLRYVSAPYPTTPLPHEADVVTDSQKGPQQTRPSSPPLLKWDPAVEPPPKDPPPPSAFFQSDTYFPNVWDQHDGKTTDPPVPALSVSSTTSSTAGETPVTSTERSPSKARQSHATFFNAPTVPEIPQMLLRQGSYSRVIGAGERDHGSPLPDPTKIRRVFPWEERPRHAPGRVFPEDEASFPNSPSVQPSATATATATTTFTPERRLFGIRPPVPSPLPEIFQHPRNTWDSPGPRKIYNKPRSPLSFKPSGSAFEVSRKSHEVGEANSQDGDVEDEVDSEGEGHAKVSSSSSTVVVATRRGLRYRSVGVQTDPREMRDQCVQVVLHSGRRMARPREVSVSSRRFWLPATGSNLLPPVVAEDVCMGAESHVSQRADSSRSMTSAIFPVSKDASEDRTPTLSSPAPTSSPSATPRQAMYDIPHLLSASSKLSAGEAVSLGSTSKDDDPPFVHSRKTSRVWDPARGVEQVKQGSEEVLAKFLKIGSLHNRS